MRIGTGKVPTVYSFSLGVQHEIGTGTTLDLAYVGGIPHLVTFREISMPFRMAQRSYSPPKIPTA